MLWIKLLGLWVWLPPRSTFTYTPFLVRLRVLRVLRPALLMVAYGAYSLAPKYVRLKGRLLALMNAVMLPERWAFIAVTARLMSFFLMFHLAYMCLLASVRPLDTARFRARYADLSTILLSNIPRACS